MSLTISIIVPVFNCEQYIDNCLKSLVEQTISSIEVLVIDDGSTDRTPEMIDRYGEAFPNVHIFHRKNEGVSAARNFGLSQAVGKYIGFVDADDFVERNMFAKMLDAIERHKTDWIECGYHKVSCGLPYRGYIPHSAAAECYENNFAEFCLNHIMEEPVVWNKLFRRSIIADNMLTFALGASEDMVFCMEYAAYSNTCTCLGEDLYYYVQRDDSIMHASKKEMYVLETWIEQFLKRIYPNKIYEQRAGALIYNYIFAKILVGILFSDCAVRCSMAEFRLLLTKMKAWDEFRRFCDDIVHNRLLFLREKQIVSRRVLLVLKGIAICNKLHCSLLAAAQMWIFSRINHLRGKHALNRQWEEAM